jgi:hypothetical protein
MLALQNGVGEWLTPSASRLHVFVDGDPGPVPSKPGELPACDQTARVGWPAMTLSRRPCQDRLGRAGPQRRLATSAGVGVALATFS